MPTRITHYDIDDVWQPQATFTVGGTPTDPTTITVKQQAPDGTETTIANAVTVSTLNASSTPVAKTSTGVLKLNPGITLNASGYWFVRFTGTGTAAASEEHQAVVDPSEFTLNAGVSDRALVSLAETKDWLNQFNVQTDNDLDLVRVINDVSDRFHQEAGREFKPYTTNPGVRTFEAPVGGRKDPWYVDGQFMGDRNNWRRRVFVGDLASYTQVQIIDFDWSTVIETTALANVRGLPLVRQPWEPIRWLELSTSAAGLSEGMGVKVTGNWGFPSVPGNVRQAVLEAVVAAMDRDVEHYRQDLSPVGSAGEGGTTVVVAGSQRLLSLPPSAQAVAWSYRDAALA